MQDGSTLARNRREWHESMERYESWKKAHLGEEPKQRRGDESEKTRIANWASKQRRKVVGGKHADAQGCQDAGAALASTVAKAKDLSDVPSARLEPRGCQVQLQLSL
mmetsp:Transcript_21232/g.46279  ORF Transcript_21232/g.46279 Transcript_21232/m.46279 type:complete len:107 (+) Transcript_21232:234-554(+)